MTNSPFMKASGIILAGLGMSGILTGDNILDKPVTYRGYPDKPLNPKQIKKRLASKRAKKARRINRKK